MSTINRVAMAALVLLACGGCSSSVTKYTSQGGNYTVDLPGTPKEEHTQQPTPVGQITMHTVSAEGSGGVLYTTMHADYPAGLARPDNVQSMLDGAANGAIQNAGSQALDTKSGTYYGHPGRELKFAAKSSTGASGRGYMRIILSGDRIYQILVVGPEAKVTDSVARTFFDSFKLNEPKAAAPDVAAGKSAADPAARPPQNAGGKIAGWGAFIDPLGDCQAQVQDETLTITVPGKLHDFAPPPAGTFDAPRVVRDVTGDFTAEVELLDELKPSEGSTRPGGAPYNGFGLLASVDDRHYVRLEKAAVNRGGFVNSYILFNGRDNGYEIGQDLPLTPGLRFLKMERRAGLVQVYASANGTDWSRLNGWNVVWPPLVKVGVIGVSSADKPFAARFRGLKITTP